MSTEEKQEQQDPTVEQVCDWGMWHEAKMIPHNSEATIYTKLGIAIEGSKNFFDERTGILSMNVKTKKVIGESKIIPGEAEVALTDMEFKIPVIQIAIIGVPKSGFKANNTPSA